LAISSPRWRHSVRHAMLRTVGLPQDDKKIAQHGKLDMALLCLEWMISSWSHHQSTQAMQ
ncbi:MAG: hypothetical protein KDK05_15335, partial [Candidatus Competibacteraceae bacterium]|nr:hypothetical protein [Candidatus Competibacteraceae bacterium]